MANPTVGFGLRYVRRLDGAADSGQQNLRYIAYNEADTIATGDLLKPLNDGLVELYDAGGTATGGVFVGCYYLNPAVGYPQPYPAWTAPSGLASTQIVTAYALDDPNMVFMIRNSSTSTAITQADVGLNADILYVAPTSTGQSKSTLDYSTILNTATLPLRIVGLYQGPGNDNTLANNIVLVRFNTSTFQTATGL